MTTRGVLAKHRERDLRTLAQEEEEEEEEEEGITSPRECGWPASAAAIFLNRSNVPSKDR